ncbi:hypothetical protein LUZ60_008536 [Juncus effusus]|nr:hypothetical protein LUZ60_008536 [Juncus effusus]
MGERKVLNKYFPPDFDPAKLPRRKQPKNKQMTVRMMLPMSIRCGTCGNYIYKGTKFNSRKEDVEGENYLGIQIFRFYFKCTKCSAEITYKTDPQNSDYTVESGASRNFEPWRNKDEEVDKEKRKREEEEMGDAMKSLENKALDSKQDMDILAALEEMRSMKSRHASVSIDDVLGSLKRSSQQKEQNVTDDLDEQDEALIKSIVFRNSKDYVKRIDDSLLDDFDTEAGPSSSKLKSSSVEKPTDTLTESSITDSSKAPTSKAGPSGFIMPKFIPKPKATNADSSKKQKVENVKPTGLMSICASYDDSDESD